jgi:hypothetical protein
MPDFGGRGMRGFGGDTLRTLSEALDVAEDVTGNFYKLSSDQWSRHPYDVKTLGSLNQEEIVRDAFAVLHRGTMVGDDVRDVAQRDYYFICLQDDRILAAVRRDKKVSLLPLLVYLFTHELVHIVRFSNFIRRFDALGKTRDEEEAVVHATTHDILRRVPLPKLGYVLEAYRDHRICHVIDAPGC